MADERATGGPGWPGRSASRPRPFPAEDKQRSASRPRPFPAGNDRSASALDPSRRETTGALPALDPSRPRNENSRHDQGGFP